MSERSETPRVIIVPEPDDVTAPYWEGARRGALLLQRCVTCSAVWHPPLPSCPRCRGADVDWFPAGGSGTVESCTVIHQAAHRAFADQVPYVVVGVRLPEGPLVVTNLVDQGGLVEQEGGGPLRVASRPVAVGTAVTVAFMEITDGIVLPQFTAAPPPPSVPAP